MQFVPVPTYAIIAAEPSEYGAVLDLYHRAHALRWRPFQITERSVCTRWGMNRYRVWSLLDTLAALDLIRIDRGGRRRPTVITVINPTAKQGGEQGGEQNAAGPTPDTGASVASDSASDRATLLRPDTKPDEDPTDPPVVADATTARAAERRAAERAAAGKLWQLWREQRRPAGVARAGALWHTGKAPSDGELGRLVKALQERAKMHRRGGDVWPADHAAAVADVEALIVAFHTGDGFAHWQGDNDRRTVYLGLGTLLGTKNMESRWDRVAQWRDAGRPVRSGAVAPSHEDKGEARRAWPWLMTKVGQHGGHLPERLADNPGVNAALWAGIKACGGIGAIQTAREQDRRSMSLRFVDAYTEARHVGNGRPPE